MKNTKNQIFKAGFIKKSLSAASLVIQQLICIAHLYMAERRRDCTHHVLLAAPEYGVDAVLGSGQEADAEAFERICGIALYGTRKNQDQEKK